jgi:hypothetical protein
MKKLILLLVLGTMVVSCKKTYTCSCTNYFPSGEVTYTDKPIKDSKEEALAKCAAEEMDPVGPYSSYRTCYLK